MTDAPDFLRGYALKKWEELASVAWRQGELDDVAAYCAAYGRWRVAEEWLAHPENGPVVTIRDDKGNIRTHAPAPQIAVGERAAREMARLSKKLRLSSRVR